MAKGIIAFPYPHADDLASIFKERAAHLLKEEAVNRVSHIAVGEPLTKKNVFQVGENLVKLMHETIDTTP